MTDALSSRRPLVPSRRLGAALGLATALGVPAAAEAQSQPEAPPQPWVPPSWEQALIAPLPGSVTPGVTPAVIPRYQALGDATGLVASFQPGGPTTTSENAFFASLGTNGRTCFSCHQPQDDWTVTPATVQAVFDATWGTDPMFAAVDGSDCPDLVDETTDEDTCVEGESLQRFVSVRRQLFDRGNFRIFLPIPAGAEWKVSIVHDPYGCEGSATYGLPAGFLSVYRRVLPSTNTFDLDPGGRLTAQGTPAFNIMWDAREPDLATQFQDAAKIHAQATPAQAAVAEARAGEGVSFQDGLFTAQAYDDLAGSLTAEGALGGPRLIATLPAGINTVALTPPAPPFSLFDTWAAAQAMSARRSIQRGQEIFDGKTRTFTIEGVPGLNDVVGQAEVQGFCGTCHNSGDRGNDFFLDPKRLGIMDNSSTALPATRDMPLFSFLCPVGAIPYFENPVTRGGVKYDEFLTTDPGVGLISGKCADLGKMKVPVLRGAAGRAPYFHGGNVASLYDLIDFYDRRFSIGFTAEERADLEHFLRSL